MKKIFTTIMCLCVVGSLTACKGNETEPESTAPSIKTYNEQLTTVATTEPTTESEPEDEHAPLVPTIEQNLSDEIDLSLVAVNGYEIDLDNLPYQSFLQMSQLRKGSVGTTSIDTSLFFFDGGMHYLNENGTKLSVELVDKDGNLVPNLKEENYKPEELYVKGLHISEDFLAEDYNVSFYAGVKIGMERDLFTAVMGAGAAIKDKYVYQNSNYTMIVEFDAKTDEAGESVWFVDEITLLRN